ncbi:hypothetical protein PR003_g7470 [Phytophthora rubi]|uniref:Uncharacterized protein n=1 Tax=Phytophthora rubi TaxID=129364 RepID=A0A6A4FPE5_9STRA|nr:hypothetical protein PR002_g7341 [Phytophthora rubi]KAE9040844.1 hypothetical protein PR001_g6887 [Phytophthora rubi]KAE9346364.1 hypothetical protein PR003_g7470 [Phytophthora rubi]
MQVFSTLALVAAMAVAARAQSSDSSAGTVSASSGATTSSASSSTTTTKKPTTTTTTTSSGSAANDFMSSLSAGSSSGAAEAKSDSYHMQPVHVVQARVQSDMPVWNEELQRFVSAYYDDATDAYVGLMDTVNTASVEGALMYVQAEGINYDTRSEEERCTRKNDMTYVVFYEYAIAQTNETLALYEDVASQNEYGTMLAMDSGRCTPSSTTSSGGEVFPTACYYFNGDEGEPDVGPFVGGTTKETDPRAPYPNNVWYSFSNTCPLQEWSAKTSECRASTRQGLCDVGVMPDGVSCTFAYRVLGFIPIDDLVGITAMVSNTTGETYANFSEFCQDGGVEFEATTDGEWIDGIPFWENPQDEDANSERATKLVEAYYNLTNGLIETSVLDSDLIAHMLPLPTPDELAAENPACYLNVKKCNSDTGCKRELYGSTCTVCNSTSDECKTPPSDWSFPSLEKAVGENGGTGDASADSSSTKDSTSSGNGGDSSSSGAAVNGVSAVLVSTLLALATALLF